MECAVATGGRESTVLGVEGDVIHAVDVGDVALRRVAVALEAEVRGRILFFDVLDGATALDGADREARGIGEAADHARLPLERTLDRLVELERILQVYDVDVAVCSADDEEVVANVHRVDSLLRGDGADGRALSEIPVFDRLIPAASDQHGTIRLW